MTGSPLALIWDLIARDKASPVFNRVATSAERAAGATASASKKIGGTAAVMGKAGAKLTKGFTVPLGLLAGVSVDQAAKFQKSMTLIQTAGGETVKKTGVISKGVLAIAKETGTGLTDLEDGIYAVAKSGSKQWSAVGQLKVLRASAQGAKAENVDLGVAVNALTSVMKGYGIGAKQAVSIENQLIRASGLSKTTFQEFASSLSNVVPLAGALHISFDQVGGAIATMTQHGESAQRATENLNNLIRSLAGQNNVASGSMQQLGINVVDLTKNLGKRGLTGTLDIVENALAKSSKGGLIAVDAFRHSQTATHDLGIALSKMPPYLQKISQEFEKGKLGYTDYREAIRSLGGRSYALGAQFLSLVQNAKGFSQALRSGNPLVSTAASMLQKMLGGATGMNVALMLGGPSRKQFKSDVGEIGQAARRTGADVLGWGKTQATLSNKIDRAKASLQVFAVEVGTKLLPAASKIVDKISSVVHWFENLSGTQKKIAVWATGVLFALGPILSLGSKLILVGRAFGTMSNMAANAFTRVATGANATNLRVASAMRGFTAAVGGAAIGVAIGTLTRNSSAGVKAIGALASAATGAAIGFGVGGPVGAAIGGLGGLLGNLATDFFDTGDAAKESAAKAKAALDDERSSAEDLFQTLKRVHGAYVPQARNVVFDQLRQSGLLDKFTAGGVNPEQLINIALGQNVKHQAKFDRVTSKLSADENLKFSAIQKSGAFAERDYETYRQSLNKTTVSSKLLAGGIANLSKEIVKNGDVTSSSTPGINGVFAANLRNRAVLKDNVDLLQKQMVKQVKSGDSAYVAGQKYETNLAALKQQADALGLNAVMVDKVVNQFSKLKPKYQSVIDVLTDKAIAALGSLQQKIDGIVNGYHQVTMTVVESNGIAHGNTSGAHRARGGFVFGAGTGTSDSIAAKLSNGEFVVRAAMAKHFGPVLEAINSGAFRYAHGGYVGGVRIPAPNLPAASRGRGGTKTVRVVVDMDPQGKWASVVQDIVLDELDYDDRLERMGSR